MKMPSFRLMILVMMVALLAAACGGGSSATSTPDTPPASPTSETSSTGSGNPEAAVQAFFEAVFQGEDPGDFVCTTTPEVAEAFTQAAAALSPTAGATVDTSGLTFTVVEETADSATVEVAGDLTFDVSGTSSTVPYAGTTVTVVNEDGSWKVCG